MKTEKQKDIEEYYKSKLNKAINLQIALILLMFFMMVISGLIGYYSAKEKFYNYPETSFVNGVEILNKNCDSSYIVKCIGMNEKWCVFAKVCRAGGYCKYNYIPLGDCLK